jgi:hypothetical protein
MSSHSRTAEREEERRLNMRTLVIASAASAAAALLTSQLWIAGTWIAAAMTPVIVALVSEMLHRPTERIAKSFTSDRVALPAAGGAAPPARPGADPLPDRAPAEPGAGAAPPRPPAPGAGSEAPVRVYRSGGADPRRTLPGDAGRPGAAARGGPTRRRRIAYRAVFATAALAFAIAVAVITVPELLAGGSVGKSDGGTTFFSGSKRDRDRDREQQAPQDTTREEQPQQQQDQQRQTPDEETPPPEEEPPPPPEAEPAPQQAPPGEPLDEAAPVPPEQP